MLILDLYEKNVYVDDVLVGYITNDGEIFVNGKKFLDMDEYGTMYINNQEVGYIEDGGDIYVNNKLVGHIDPSNNIRFNSQQMK